MLTREWTQYFNCIERFVNFEVQVESGWIYKCLRKSSIKMFRRPLWWPRETRHVNRERCGIFAAVAPRLRQKRLQLPSLIPTHLSLAPESRDITDKSCQVGTDFLVENMFGWKFVLSKLVKTFLAKICLVENWFGREFVCFNTRLVENSFGRKFFQPS